ncbi:MAG: hypothetical protein K2G87_02795 [Oscillospiraceae bacterium]|nr:hypothetical protein [Oscillospiraceae bacterium]
MKFSNTNLITEEVTLDERQKALIGEISTDCIRLWYTLNFTVTIFAAVFALALSGIITVGRTYVLAVLALYFVITFLCLSVFNVKAAAKGVLTEFMGVKLNGRGRAVTIFTYVFAMIYMVRDYMTGGRYFVYLGIDGIIFFGVLVIIGIIYDIILLYCRKKNKAVNEESEEE